MNIMANENGEIVISDELLEKHWLDKNIEVSNDTNSVVDEIKNDVLYIEDWKRNLDGEIEMDWNLFEESGREYIRMKYNWVVLCYNQETDENFKMEWFDISIEWIWIRSKEYVWTFNDRIELEFISNQRHIQVKARIKNIRETQEKSIINYWVEFENISEKDKNFIFKKSSKKDSHNIVWKPIDENTPTLVMDDSEIESERSARVDLYKLWYMASGTCINSWNSMIANTDNIISISESWLKIVSYDDIYRDVGSKVELDFEFLSIDNNSKFKKRRISMLWKIAHKSKRDKDTNEIYFWVKITKIKQKDREFIKDIVYANLQGIN